MITIAGICGSLRGSSLNAMMLQVLAAMRPPDVEYLPWNDLAAVPPFDEDTEHSPAPSVETLRSALLEADALVVATPEYNGGMPGQLKNALDWASRPHGAGPLQGLPVGIVGASLGRSGAVGGVEDVRRVLTHIGADVLEDTVTVAVIQQRLDDAGTLADPDTLEQLRRFGAAVGDRARRDAGG